MTKILTRKCSVPARSGDIKDNFCDFNTLYNIQMDVELYNYVDILLFDYRNGRLNDKQLASIRQKALEEEDQPKGGLVLNAGVTFNTLDMALPGLTFRRDNADFMNNFFVNIIAHAFTDIEEFLRQQALDRAQDK